MKKNGWALKLIRFDHYIYKKIEKFFIGDGCNVHINTLIEGRNSKCKKTQTKLKNY